VQGGEAGKSGGLRSRSMVGSGLGIRRSNTVMVDGAEMLGRGQRYQVRGRVGRSKTRA